jgi:Uma2 family endonuclease
VIQEVVMSSPVPSPVAEEVQSWQPRAEELMRIINQPFEDVEVIAQAVQELADLLPSEDGIPMESPWHRAAINLLIDILLFLWRDRDDFYVGGNMFVYYLRRGFPLPRNRGPDFFYVSGVDGKVYRDKWAAFVEGKSPEVIIEFLSPTTAKEDRTVKKDVYEEYFQTDEYFLFDPKTTTLEGWRLTPNGLDKKYQALEPDQRGWMWSQRLHLWLGPWTGEFQKITSTWLRFYDVQGRLLLHKGETIDELQAELERLRAQIAAQERGQQHG